MIPKSPTNSKQLATLLEKGEGLTLEFKRSTGELKEGMQSLCAFKNGSGGLVLFGIKPDCTVEGQQVSDKTLRDLAQALDGFEPPFSCSLSAFPSGRIGKSSFFAPTVPPIPFPSPTKDVPTKESAVPPGKCPKRSTRNCFWNAHMLAGAGKTRQL